MRTTAGFSLDHQRGLQAQNYDASTNQVIPFTCHLYPNGATFSDCTAYFWAMNPAVAASYTLTTSDSLYATFSDKSRFAMIKERYSDRYGQALPNPDLGPERSRNWTFGYSHAFASRTVVQMDLFRSDVRDAIENASVDVVGTAYQSQCQTPTACKVSVNVGKEIREGFEFTVRSTPLPRLMLDANYSFLNRSLPTTPTAISLDGLPATVPTVYLTGTPKHKLVGTATVRLPRQMLFVTTARYESGTYYQFDGGALAPSLAPPFATVDLGGAVPFGSKLNLQLGVKNLFDRLYYYQEGYPQPGRNWYVNMRFRY